MPRFLSTSRYPLALRRWMVCCLMVALPLCGLSASLFQVLGPLHVHRADAVAQVGLDELDGWQDFRRGGGRAVRPRPHTHAHGMFERHRHDPADASVIAIDGAAGADVDALSLAFLSLTFASADGLAWTLPGPAGTAWPVSATPDFESHTGALPERPPQA